MDNREMYYTKLEHDKGSLWIAGSEAVIIYIGGFNETFEDLQQWVTKKYPKSHLVEGSKMIADAVHQLEDYLNGEKEHLTMNLDISHGTSFQQDVWKALRNIPYGVTASYSEIANQIGRPEAVRAVAGAIGANRILIAVPCHRVIGKNGKLTGFRGGLEMKKSLLQLES